MVVLLTSWQTESESSDWGIYNADEYSSSYSNLNQINKDNADQLRMAWVYNSDDLGESRFSTIETNPIFVDHEEWWH